MSADGDRADQARSGDRSRSGPLEGLELFDRLPIAALLFDDAGRVIEANPATGEVTGHEHTWLRSGAIVEILAETDQATFGADWPQFLEHGRAQGHYLLRRSDGVLVGVEYQAVANVRPGVHLATFRDVTAERRARAELRFQSEVLASAGEAVIVTAPDGRVEYWNAHAERLYGWPADEVLGRHILDVTSVQGAVPRGPQVRATLAAGQTWSGELTVRDRQGRTFPVWTTSTPLLDDDGQLSGVIGVSRDVSELREAQEQVQRRASQQQVVAQLGAEVLDVRDLDAVLHRVCEIVAEVLDVELADVLELSDDNRVLWLRAGVGWQPGRVGHAQLPNSAESRPGHALTCDEPVIVSDAAEERRFDRPELLREHDVTSGISVAIPREQRTYGVLGVHSRRPRAFGSDDATFLRSVANVIGAAVDRHAATVELERLALADGLTGLANRTLLVDRLERILARHEGARRRLSVVLADLEGLKLVNDALGRARGDELLVEVARRIRSLAPEGSTVARVGDDEFVVAYEHEDADEAAASSRSLELARRLRAAITDHYGLGEREVFVTAYVGVVVQTDGDDAASLLRKVEAAARHAKGQAGDRVLLYEPDVDSQVGPQLELINELRHALMGREFLVAYQPEIDLRTGELFGLEALVRWDHPTRGVLAPSAFLETAASIGLLESIGRQVLREACHHAAELGRRHPELSGLAIAVNVSADQLVEPGFVNYVKAMLARAGLAPERLFLEITEGAIIEDHDGTLVSLEQLRELGVQIALDDFGTGFSSLTHLHRFPLDLLKIDKSFVDRVTEGGTARKIVEATLGLARTLGLQCVAEGVETEDDLRELGVLGCEIGQGYLWSPPLLAADLERWLQRFSEAAG